MKTTHKIGVQGIFRLEKLKKGKVVWDSGWNTNLVLDEFFRGLNQAGTNKYLGKVIFGTGTTPPTPGDSGIESAVGGEYSYTGAVGTSVDATSDPDKVIYTQTRMFNTVEGEVVGNIAEFIIGDLYSGRVVADIRSLIKDPQGQPTTVTVLADETLRLTHKFIFKETKVYPASVVNLNGVDYTVRIGRNPSGNGTGGNLQYNFWLQTGFTVRRAINAIPLGTQAYVKGNANFAADGTVTFSGGQVVNIERKYVRDTGNSDIMKVVWDCEVLASTSTINDDLVSLGMFQGYSSSANWPYMVYHLTFDPPLAKNPNNKLSFKVELLYERV